jgi:hypothetical protein
MVNGAGRAYSAPGEEDGKSLFGKLRRFRLFPGRIVEAKCPEGENFPGSIWIQASGPGALTGLLCPRMDSQMPQKSY